MFIITSCQTCKQPVELAGSGRPLTIMATRCPHCNALVAQVFFPGGPVIPASPHTLPRRR